MMKKIMDKIKELEKRVAKLEKNKTIKTIIIHFHFGPGP